MRPDYDQVYYDCKAIETFMNQAAQAGLFENIEQVANLKKSFDNVRAVVLEARNPRDFEERLQALQQVQKNLYGMAGELGRLFPQADCAQSISAGMMMSDNRERLSAEKDPHADCIKEGSGHNGAYNGAKIPQRTDY